MKEIIHKIININCTPLLSTKLSLNIFVQFNPVKLLKCLEIIKFTSLLFRFSEKIVGFFLKLTTLNYTPFF